MMSTVTLFQVKTQEVRKQQRKLERKSLLRADKTQDFKDEDRLNFRNPPWHFFKKRMI